MHKSVRIKSMNQVNKMKEVMKKILHIAKSITAASMLLFLLGSCYVNIQGDDLVRIIPLSGYWKFSVGDNMKWARPNYDDSKWDEIHVPGRWEESGYDGYNGYAWYRKKFNVDDMEISPESNLYLVFGRIDDADEVYLNGKLIAGSGKMPPDYVSAYSDRRKYLVPANLLIQGGENTLAVRVYDSYLEGGIVSGPVGFYLDDNNQYLEQDLSGEWKFHPGDNKQWRKPGYKDNLWDTLNVPADWESQGYPQYDGYAWYRKSFTLNRDLRKEELYLSLGKIDDYDYVYLNGELIGSVFQLDHDGEYSREGMEYRARRIYAIPEDLLKTRDRNVLAIRVYDGQSRGGIYEGPIGIMTAKEMKEYVHRHHSNQPFWDFIIDEFFND